MSKNWKMLFLVALGVRIAFSLCVGFLTSGESGGPFNYPDSLSYQAHAKSLVENGRFGEGPLRASRPPLYPAFLAACQKLSGPHRLAWVIPQALLGALSCLWLLAIGRNLATEGAGRLAAWALAFYPAHLAYTPMLMTETVFLFFFLGFAAFATARPGAGSAILAGSLGALTVLTRPGLLPFPPLAFLLAACLFRWLPRHALLALAVYGAGLTPWTLRNHQVLGRWVPVTSRLGHDLYEGNCPEATGGPVSDRIRWPDPERKLPETERDEMCLRHASRYIAEHPARTAYLATVKFFRLWNLLPNDRRHRTSLISAVSIATYGCALAAAIWSALRFPGAAAFWTLALALSLTATHCVLIGSIRYRLPVEPFLLLLAAHGLLQTFRGRTTI